MSAAMRDFRNVIRFFGPLAGIQVLAFVAAALLIPDNPALLFVSQLTVTMIAAGAGFRAGRRNGLAEAAGRTTP